MVGEKIKYLWSALTVVIVTLYIALQLQIPTFSLATVTPNANHAQALPFYELMTPLVEAPNAFMVPEIHYKKGPPEYFLSKIAFSLLTDNQITDEKIIFYGRKQEDSWLYHILPTEKPMAEFIKDALLYVHNKTWPNDINLLQKPFYHFLYLIEAKNILAEKPKTIYIMDQANIPAFLFIYDHGNKATMKFFRRDRIYEVSLQANSTFKILNPLKIFTASFLSENRAEALQYLGKKLNQISFEEPDGKTLGIAKAAWPLLLLSARLSLDPTSIETFYHYAGLNTLLYKNYYKNPQQNELSDIFRNNILATALYTHDIDPSAKQTMMIAVWQRQLLQQFTN